MSGVVRAERLFRARRRARRRQSAWPVLAAAIVTTILGGVLWVGMYSSVLRLERVTVTGTSRLSAADVLSVARIHTGGSMLQVPTDRVRRRVACLLPVASVEVRRSWPHRLVIAVTERKPVAAVASPGGGAVLVDGTGDAFATDAAPPANSLDLRVPTPQLGTTDPVAHAALEVYADLPPVLRERVQWVAAGSADDVSFSLTNGATVRWGSAVDPTGKLAVLAALLRHHAHVYDVSTPTVAVTS